MPGDPSPHEPHEVIGGRYRVVSRLGVGGMGVVYKAIDLRLNRPVAVKAVEDRRLLLSSSSGRLRAEALAAASLDHPFICKIFELVDSGAETFIVMEFVEGETLASMLHRGAIPLQQTLQIGREIAEGLANAHAGGIVHRDVKPANVMLTTSGHVKLLDFGIAGADISSTPGEQTRTMTPHVTTHAGTPQYMAPEQAAGQPITARADIFSLGVVLYECLTGSLPFSGATTFDYVRNLMQSAPRRLDRIAPETPAAVVDLVERCLEKTPADRPDAVEVVANLRRLAGALTSPDVAMPTAREARVGRRWKLVATLAILVAAGAIAWQFVPRSPATPLRQSRSFVTSPAAESGSSISPDGEWVAFISAAGGSSQVMVQRVNGGEARPVTLGPGRPISQTWSPDGLQLACLLRQADGAVLQIYPAFFGGAPLQSFALDPKQQQIYLLRWIGRAIYLEMTDGGGRVSLRRLDLDGGSGPADVSSGWKLPGQLRSVDVSPDGRAVALSLFNDDRTDLWTADIDGSSARAITDDAFFDRYPLWNGRGDRILFQSNRGGQIDLWEIDPRSRAATPLTSGPMEEVAESTSADGSLITFQLLSQEARLWIWNDGDASGLPITQDALNDYALTAGGGRLAFQRGQQAPSAGVQLIDAELFVAPFDGAALTSQPQSIGSGFAPRLSADSTSIAYLQRTDATQTARLMVRNLTSGATSIVSPAVPLPISSNVPADWAGNVFAWTGAGTSLFFVERPAEAGAMTLRRIEPGGTAGPPIAIAHSADEFLRDLAVAPGDGRLAYLAVVARKTQLRVLPTGAGAERAVASWDAPFTAVFVRGWLDDAIVVVRRLTLHDDRTADIAVEMVDVGSGRVRSAGTIPHGFISTTRLDARRRALYVTGVEGGIHNLYEFSLAAGSLKRLTRNGLAGVTFSGLHPAGPGSLLGTREERRQDIWLIQDASTTRSGNAAGR